MRAVLCALGAACAAAFRAPQAAKWMPKGHGRVQATTEVEAAAVATTEHVVVGDDAVAKYVRAHGGRRAIRRVLIANNGMAATKSIMSMRRWAYLELGDEKAIEFVVMATPEDLNANAEFVRLADKYVQVPGGSNANNYANVKLIVDVAIEAGVDAVWPGWGHASENPKLPRALIAANIAFMGPPPSVMAVLGDKIAANILAQTAKVPSIPWSGSWGNPEDDGPLQALLNDDGTIPQSTFDAACVTSLESALAAAERIGYPVMLKASEGGGGKGIRMNADAEEMTSSWPQVTSEVPGSPVFVMQLVTGARHLEVQVVGDEWGNAIALSGRDCSTQRRFQKIFEEGPPTWPTGGVADPEVFKDMEKKARDLVQSIGYVGAGTVEYLYDASTNTYSFLELNPRLQVEHPVTEGVTGVNLPATQLQVAMGIPLAQMPEIRALYGVAPTDVTTLVDVAEPYELLGGRHVLAARITAENPDEGFKPTSGRIERVSFQSTPNVWGYFSVGANGGVHEFADSQFGHLFATGLSREEARKAMVLALKELTVRGDIRNPVEYLVQLLETEDFKANRIDTSWLDGLLKAKAISKTLDDEVVVAAAALFRAHETCKSANADFGRALDQGQFSTAIYDDLDTFETSVVVRDVKYSIDATRTGRDSFSMVVRGDSSATRFSARAREQPDGTLLCDIGGVSRKLTGLEEPLGLRMSIDGATVFIPAAFDPSEVRSDVTGKLVRWLVEDGAEVQQGKPYAEVEAMKMIMPMRAAETGSIKHFSTAGSVINTGDLLAKLALKDASKARTIAPFSGAFNAQGRQAVKETETISALGRTAVNGALQGLQIVLEGFALATPVADLVKTAFVEPGFFLRGMMKLEARDASGAIGQKMPADLDAALVAMSDDATAGDLAQLLEKYSGDVALNPLRALVVRWQNGGGGVAADTVATLFESFLAIEEKFVGFPNKDTAIRNLLKTAPKRDAAATLFSHSRLSRRAEVVQELLKALPKLQQSPDTEASHRLLVQCERLAALESCGPAYAAVALTAGMTKLEAAVPSYDARVLQMRDELAAADDLTAFAFNPTLGSYQRGVDILTFLFDDADESVRASAVEVYVRRMYSAHDVLDMEIVTKERGAVEARFWYKFRSDDPASAPLRFGKLVVAKGSLDQLTGELPEAILPDYEKDFKAGRPKMAAAFGDVPAASGAGALNTLHVLLPGSFSDYEDEALILKLEAALAVPKTAAAVSNGANLRSVNIIATSAPLYPRYFTFVGGDCLAGGNAVDTKAFKEDPLRRGMRPTFYHLLELSRASENYALTALPTVNRDLRVYIGDEKAPKVAKFAGQCVFVRRVTHSTDLGSGGAARLLDKALDALDMALLDSRVKKTASSRLFVNVIAPLEHSDGAPMSPTELDAGFKMVLGDLISSRAARLLAANVDEIEVKFALKDGPNVKSARCVATSAGGPWLALRTYIELTNPVTGVATGYCDIDGENCVVDPYPAADNVGRKRAQARAIGTTYAYDFPGLLEKALFEAWRDRAADVAKYGGGETAIPRVDELIRAKELLLDDEAPFGVSSKQTRAVGTNKVGMVAWDLDLKTPEYPAGRRVLLIANDVTYQSGSFGVAEDDFFAKVSRMAASSGTPRLYVSSNSGARIGLVEPLKEIVTAKWIDDDPLKGLSYLGVTAAALKALPAGSVVAKPLNDDGLHELEAIIGSEDQVPDGIGVENLKGSGLIAGITAQAYSETFTLSYATGRSVGIGAYLMRLGQRVVQSRTGPMILTGYQALNKLLGKNVYTSQDQLGGPQIMSPNGITHTVVSDDYEGSKTMINWLSYVPENAKSAVVLSGHLPVADPIDRPVGAAPPADGSAYDVRGILDNDELGGLFDTGSFTETLADWGKTVVAGRAKLGGMPFGVIAVETRTVEAVQPADPANPLSREAVLPQAGQVWYPDSAQKTATAIRDFDKGERLPLLILANWRGFSGGTRDMFDAVLKFGAQIVDALVDYEQPVFVYIPPQGELRGGAWVVVDPSINADMMEMYADPLSRGGILEPPGIVEVKYRKADQVKTMHRLDSELIKLDAAPVKDEAAIRAREVKLAPLYQNLAVQFADLHDRTGRMEAKGVISAAVQWRDARTTFYWRAKYRLLTTALAKAVLASGAVDTYAEAAVKVAAVVPAAVVGDEAKTAWLLENVAATASFVETAATAGVVKRLKALLTSRPDAAALVAEAMKTL